VGGENPMCALPQLSACLYDTAMRDDKVFSCFRDSMDVELRPRDREVRTKVEGIDRVHRLNGSGIQARGDLGCTELSARAEIIWEGMRRCFRTYQTSAPDESLVGDLSKDIDYWIRNEARTVTALVNATWAPPQAKSHIPQVVEIRRDELLNKMRNEVKFYVRGLMNPPPQPEPPTTYTIVGPVGVIQSGPNAHADVRIDMGGTEQLLAALKQLQAAIPRAADMTAEQQQNSLEVTVDLISAASASKVNVPKIVGLYKALGYLVGGVSSLYGAWEAVHAAATAMGIAL
jgi:hypothetical protein